MTHQKYKIEQKHSDKTPELIIDLIKKILVFVHLILVYKTKRC
jgi:hypothetical protein